MTEAGRRGQAQAQLTQKKRRKGTSRRKFPQNRFHFHFHFKLKQNKTIITKRNNIINTQITQQP